MSVKKGIAPTVQNIQGRAGVETASLVAAIEGPPGICRSEGLSRRMKGRDMGTRPPTANPESRDTIVFFDGVCGLCNRFVDFTLARDHAAYFLFAPLQGETFAARVGATRHQERLRSIVFWDGQQAHVKSEAVLRIVERLGGGWLLVRPLLLVPLALRDSVYDCVAKNRYRWFGKRETCRLPSKTEKERFLP